MINCLNVPRRDLPRGGYVRKNAFCRKMTVLTNGKTQVKAVKMALAFSYICVSEKSHSPRELVDLKIH